MATFIYDTGRNAFLNGGINWTSDTIKACLVHNSAGGTSYTPNSATDAFLSIIPGGAIIAAGVQIPSASDAAGVANGGTLTFSSVTGVQIDAIVLYKDTGVAGTSQLIAYIDSTAPTSGLPFTPSGGNISIAWDTGANKILKL
jgi:uncharacterized heparinase superfamily protein